MKVLLQCLECSASGGPAVYSSGELQNDELYESVCANGHRTLTLLTNHKWALLFDSGALALRDGYYRESVATFTAALEDLYAFCTKVYCLARGVDPRAYETFRKATKLSERRVGAFHLAYLLEHGQPFPHDTNQRREFRNRIIHDGVWPSRAEAHDYAAYVYRVALELGQYMMVNHPDSYLLSAVTSSGLARRAPEATE
jgi:hypothetical protein